MRHVSLAKPSSCDKKTATAVGVIPGISGTENIQTQVMTQHKADIGHETPVADAEPGPTTHQSPLASPATAADTPSPPTPSLSPYHRPVCKRMQAWGDICFYGPTCWDGNAWWVLYDGGQPRATAKVEVGNDDLTTGLLYPRNDVPSYSDEFIPFNSGYMSYKRLHPDVLKNDSLKITWHTGTMWRLAFQASIENTWYTASRSMPLYRARMLNETGWFNPPLPQLDKEDIVYIGVKAHRLEYDWGQHIFALATGNKTKIEYLDGDWNKQWNSDNVVCFKRMVATGTFAPAVPDLETAFKFREDMYKLVGVQLPDKPAKKVLFWLRRPSEGRGIINADELFDVAKSYNLSYTVVYDFPRDFKSQLEMFASHGVMVSPHGAGLMNVIFMVPFSAVVEIFQYHFDHNLYSTAAVTSGLGYYPVHCYNGTDIWANFENNFKLNCEDITSFGVNVDRQALCRMGAVFYKMKVEVRDFEAALINAVNHAGYRVRFRNWGPTPDSTTKTGFK